MAPIRVGLIGLSTSHFPEPGCWAAFVHLPSILNSPDYKLVAIANSTVQSARNSIAAHGLPSTTKAYGSPEDLANEPEVDLVVVSVRVGKHFELTQPAILSKKSVFVEWPLGASLAEAQQLTELAQANGVKTMVGLQTRGSRLVLKLKEAILNGKIGKVISSSVLASSSVAPTAICPQGLEYYLDMKSAGNEFYMYFGHCESGPFLHLLPRTHLTTNKFWTHLLIFLGTL